MNKVQFPPYSIRYNIDRIAMIKYIKFHWDMSWTVYKDPLIED